MPSDKPFRYHEVHLTANVYPIGGGGQMHFKDVDAIPRAGCLDLILDCKKMGPGFKQILSVSWTHVIHAVRVVAPEAN